MEKKDNCTKLVHSIQLDMFKQPEPLLSSSMSFNCINTPSERSDGFIINMSTYRTQQQVQKFYEEAARLTAHLSK